MFYCTFRKSLNDKFYYCIIALEMFILLYILIINDTHESTPEQFEGFPYIMKTKILENGYEIGESLFNQKRCFQIKMERDVF